MDWKPCYLAPEYAMVYKCPIGVNKDNSLKRYIYKIKVSNVNVKGRSLMIGCITTMGENVPE